MPLFFDSKMNLEDFNYECPEHLIAQEPLSNRDDCKLLVIEPDSKINHFIFKDIINLLPKNALLILNDTKVIPARIPIKRKSGGRGEMLIQEQMPNGDLLAMGRPSKRLKVGERLNCLHNENYEIELLESLDHGNWKIKFIPEIIFPEQLHLVGEIPLPPYIERKDGPNHQDLELYQTVFAEQPGSAAAPTASLHFTPELLSEVLTKGIQIEKLTLHVGTGTFLPVRTESLEDHVMHLESYVISENVSKQILKAKSEKRPIVAVGTTVVRALESASELILQGKAAKDQTQLFIRPPYQFKVVDELITNFHLPKSTLLMLVSALCGVDTLKQAYQVAVNSNYRFFSYGDAMYLRKKLTRK